MNSQFPISLVITALILVAGCKTAVPERQVQSAPTDRSAPPLPPLPPSISVSAAKASAMAAPPGGNQARRIATVPSAHTLKLLSNDNADPNLAYPWAVDTWILPEPWGAQNNILFTNLTAGVVYSTECRRDGTNWMVMGWTNQFRELGGQTNLGLTLVDQQSERAAVWRLRSTLPQEKTLQTLVQSNP